MDLKILRQDISVNSEIFNQSAEQSIDLELTLPDYYPKICRILKCTALPRIASDSINGQTLSVEGNVYITIMYTTNEGEICSYEYVMPFSRGFECESDTVCSMASCCAKPEYINCRLVSENQIELHGAVGINAKILKKQSTVVVSDVDGGSVMLERGNAPATSPIGVAEKYMPVEEELELSAGQPSVNNIIRYDVRAVNKDCKIISGKIAVKGELQVFVLYCGEQVSTPQSLRTSIPYSQILEIDGINDDCDCECKTRVAQVDIKPRTSITGETRTLSLNAKLHFCATACCNNDIPVIYDAFSTKYDAKITKNDIVFEKIFKTVNDNFVCRKKIELNTGNVGTVIDMWCDPQVSYCRIENGEVKTGGMLNIGFLAYDSDNQPAYYEKPIDFDYTLQADGALNTMKCDTEVTLVKLSYTILNNTCVEVTAELSINSTIYSARRISVVSDVEINTDALKPRETDAALIIYYAQCGEKVWDIARRYNSSPEEIAEINTIDTAEITQNKTLLIPVK